MPMQKLVVSWTPKAQRLSLSFFLMVMVLFLFCRLPSYIYLVIQVTGGLSSFSPHPWRKGFLISRRCNQAQPRPRYWCSYASRPSESSDLVQFVGGGGEVQGLHRLFTTVSFAKASRSCKKDMQKTCLVTNTTQNRPITWSFSDTSFLGYFSLYIFLKQKNNKKPTKHPPEGTSRLPNFSVLSVPSHLFFHIFIYSSEN